jgi:hypothetical protein
MKRHSTDIATEPLDPTELTYAHAWGFKAWQWQVLTDSERRDYRDRVVFAPNLSTEGK